LRKKGPQLFAKKKSQTCKMQSVLHPSDDEEVKMTMQLKAAVTAEIEECDRKMASHIRSLFARHRIITIDGIPEPCRAMRLNEAMMLMESIFSIDFSVERLFDTPTDSYMGVTKKLLMFAPAPRSLVDQTTRASASRSIAESASEDPCKVEYFDHRGEESELDLCTHAQGGTTVESFRTLVREQSDVRDALLTLDCVKREYLLNFGITLPEAVRVLGRWNDGEYPEFDFFPDFDCNMLPRCVALLTRRRFLQ
tara:strand:- start:257 stop:1012 length:756 start_codon:yes stop_codon:yes gene_type:complete